MGSRALFSLGAFLAASAWCVLLLKVREHAFGEARYGYLVWNLTLAWIPLVLAMLLVVAYSRRRPAAELVVVGAAWLVFLPNAPYVLTDFIHLGERPSAPLWYDALMLSAFAWTGLLLGFASLYLVQMIVRRAYGSTVAWLGVLAALVLASAGVYVGRFIRFNSWDALLHPVHVAEVINDQLSEVPARMAEALVGLTGFLLVGYLVVYAFTDLELELEPEN
jgi:uncharacterized membrane protein